MRIEDRQENRPLSRSEIDKIFRKTRIEMSIILDKIRDEKFNKVKK